MPNISIIADSDFIEALYDDADLPMEERQRVNGTVAESERLGFELGSIETLIGLIVAGIHAIDIARHIIAAAKKSKHPKLELISPSGRVSFDLEGKSEEEVSALVRAALPFTR